MTGTRLLIGILTTALGAASGLRAEPTLEGQAAAAGGFFELNGFKPESPVLEFERARASAKAVATSVAERAKPDPPPKRDQPAFDKLGCEFPGLFCHTVPGAKYKPVEGRLFEKGEGDARAASPTDIDQGRLADCYFMASLGAIAHKDPRFLRRMISRNKDGSFSVRLYKKHWFDPLGLLGTTPQTITVDNEFPMRRGSPVFAGYGDELDGKPELWPMVAEKAYAMLHRDGSYNAIGQGGFAGLALQALTGKPSLYRLALTTSIEELAAWDAQGYAMVANTTPNKHRGLARGHAYWVESVDTANRTVTLVNPWSPKLPHVTITERAFHRTMISVQATLP